MIGGFRRPLFVAVPSGVSIVEVRCLCLEGDSPDLGDVWGECLCLIGDNTPVMRLNGGGIVDVDSTSPSETEVKGVYGRMSLPYRGLYTQYASQWWRV